MTRIANASRVWVSAAAIAAAGLTGGCKQENEYVAPPPPTVTVTNPTSREITLDWTFTGRTEALETVEVRARVSGYLESVHFEPSQVVEAGQLLFKIEDGPYVAAKDAAEAELASTRASLTLAENTLERTKLAFEARAANEIEVIRDQAARDSAEAAVNSAIARLDRAALDLEYTEVRSPMRGRISKKEVSEGNLVGTTEATLLTTIVVDDPIFAYFTISERVMLEALQNRPRSDDGTRAASEENQRAVRMELTDRSMYSETGFIDFADNRLDPSTGSLLARAVFPNADANLFPGLFVRLMIPKSEVPQTELLIPEVAVMRDQLGTYVLIVDDGTVRRNNINPGEQVKNMIGGMPVFERIVLAWEESGEMSLSPDARVVYIGLQRAREGMKVDATLKPYNEMTGVSAGTAPAESDGEREPSSDGSDG